MVGGEAGVSMRLDSLSRSRSLAATVPALERVAMVWVGDTDALAGEEFGVLMSSWRIYINDLGTFFIKKKEGRKCTRR